MVRNASEGWSNDLTRGWRRDHIAEGKWTRRKKEDHLPEDDDDEDED